MARVRQSQLAAIVALDLAPAARISGIACIVAKTRTAPAPTTPTGAGISHEAVIAAVQNDDVGAKISEVVCIVAVQANERPQAPGGEASGGTTAYGYVA